MRDVNHIEGARLAKCGLTPFLFFATIKIQRRRRLNNFETSKLEQVAGTGWYS
jgi:hypothetical protein